MCWYGARPTNNGEYARRSSIYLIWPGHESGGYRFKQGGKKKAVQYERPKTLLTQILQMNLNESEILDLWGRS